MTSIHTTRKLEKISKGFIQENVVDENEHLGSWSATYFNMSYKKCWVLINKTTKYTLILPNIKKIDLENFSSVFNDALYEQLILDGIVVERPWIEKLIGDVILRPTSNDRVLGGTLNNILLTLEHWKNEFQDFDNMPFRDLNSRLNAWPHKSMEWCYPKEKMSEILNHFFNKSL